MIFDPQILLVAAQAVEHAPEPAGFIGTLGINWKLFLAQLVNFAVVILVLWKWVMKPVVGALEARRAKIEDSLQKAKEIEERVQKFAAHKEQELRRVRAEAQDIFSRATAAAENAKAEMVTAARVEGERLMAEAKAAIEVDKQAMMRELREEVAGLTVMATEKILREKMDQVKDKKLIEEVIRSIN